MKKLVVIFSLGIFLSWGVLAEIKTEITPEEIKFRAFIYEKLQGKWIKNNFVTKETFDFIKEIEESYYEGLQPELYLQGPLSEIIKNSGEGEALYRIVGKRNEKLLNNLVTDVFIRFTRDLYFGITYKKYRDLDNTIVREELKYYEKMMDLNYFGYSNFDTRGIIDEYRPKIKLYSELRMLYKRISEIEKNKKNNSEFGLYNTNMTPSELKKTVKVNLERLRKLQIEYPEKYILINIPTYKLKIFNNNKVDMEMKVVVGKKDRKTPVLMNTMRYFVVNPTWSIPETIIKKDVIAAYIKDPEYFTKNKIKIYRDIERATAEIDPTTLKWEKENIKPLKGYKFVQESNEKNVLGKVKFILENKENIYLHDTQAKELFKKNERMFSSGCIRLEQPLELADYLFADGKKWNKAYLKKVLEKYKDHYVGLPKPIKVYVTYFTAYLNEKNELEFLNDIYGKDSEMLFEFSRLAKLNKREG